MQRHFLYTPIFEQILFSHALPILFAIAVLVSLYDLRIRRIPNWVTLPLWVAGFIVHFPSAHETLLASATLVIAFTRKWMGEGDVKLWLALIWAMPEISYSHGCANVWCFG